MFLQVAARSLEDISTAMAESIAETTLTATARESPVCIVASFLRRLAAMPRLIQARRFTELRSSSEVMILVKTGSHLPVEMYKIKVTPAGVTVTRRAD